MAEIQFDDQVDITDKVCPLTFVKAKVAIEELDDGEVLAIRMNDGEPVQNVPRSMKEEGHKILKLEDNADGTYTLYVRKVEKVLKSDLPVIVDFYSDSCIACKKLAPALGDVEDDYEGKLYVYKVNTNFDKELAKKYQIAANPTLLFVKNAEVLDRKIGAHTLAELKTWVDALL